MNVQTLFIYGQNQKQHFLLLAKYIHPNGSNVDFSIFAFFALLQIYTGFSSVFSEKKFYRSSFHNGSTHLVQVQVSSLDIKQSLMSSDFS